MTPSTTVHSPLRLYGRSGELAILDTLLVRLRNGDGGALVLTALPGVGRTALLEKAVAAHRERRTGPVLCATAAPAEQRLPYSGLHALLCSAPGPLPLQPDRVLRDGITPTELLVLLRELGSERPLLVCVDDAHAWDPDSRAALVFAARRLGAGSRVAVVIGAGDETSFAGLPALRLGPLDDDAAAALLDRITDAAGVADQVDPVVRGELIREAAGNPRLLAGLAARLTPGQLAGRTPPPYPLPGAEDVLEAHAARLDGLPPDTRTLLLLAAAAQEHEPEGAGADVALLLRAAASTGLGPAVLDQALLTPAGTAGALQRAGDRLHFSHPLLRRAVLHRASPQHRRAVHGLLAALLTAAPAGARGRVRRPPRWAAGAGGGGLGLSGRTSLPGAGVSYVTASGSGARPGDGRAASSAFRPGEGPVVGAGVRPGEGWAVGSGVRPGDGPVAGAGLRPGGGRVAAAGFRPGDTRATGSVSAPAPGLAPVPAPFSDPAPVPVPGAGGVSRSDRVLPPQHGVFRPGAGYPAAGPAGLPALVQRACAAEGPDDGLADALEAAAVAPRPHAERAAALARAAVLSSDEEVRAARFAAAAEHTRLAGDAGRARALLARVGARPAHDGAHLVRGLLALRDGPAADAHEALLTTAALLAPHDPRRALDAQLGAAEAAWAMGDALAYLDAMTRMPVSVAEPALAQYCDGMSAVLCGRIAEGQALLRRCLASAGRADDPAQLLRGGVSALVLGDVDAACRFGTRALAAVRSAGPEALLPQALEHLAYAELRAGRHAPARAHALEGLHAARRTGQPNIASHLHAVLALAASVEGGTEACAAHADAALAGAGPNGLVQAATLATWALARADLAAGRSGEAAARLDPLVRPGPRRGHFATRMLAVPCYVEASVLAGRAERGRGADPVADAVAEFAVWVTRTTDPQAPAQLARCRALLAAPADVAGRYEEALAHHDRAGGDFERARTQLLHGAWLRRRRRTREARGPLRDALVAFERCGARAWTDRASGELRAAGEAVEGPAAAGGTDPLAALTPQQQRIARCVAEGATNREVALRLSVSTRTVDHHLRNVFAALGVRSRTELARLLDR
ncbi:AAA family ATPase [Streptomyces sp. NBC_00236]|uniref:helix-turn-helix transcriptional regulator n=1 Tax=unclassified Streptomyces TaxID=2593676 RepID=UPI002E2E3974|nr:LuxR C-terminal-related transcriptional regulator [Streptomyces sp. NBC_00236]